MMERTTIAAAVSANHFHLELVGGTLIRSF
jgi:hypothetical protein